MKRSIRFLILLFFVLLLIGGIGRLSIISHEAELEYLLEGENIQGSSNITLSVIGQIKILTERLNSQSEPISYYNKEARIQTLSSLSPLWELPEEDVVTLPWLVRISRSLFSKESRTRTLRADTMTLLEEAYYRERLRQYDEAIDGYTELLSMNLEPVITDIIRLHLAYCSLETGNYRNAGNICLSLSTEAALEEISMAAGEMIRFINNLEAYIVEQNDKNLQPMAVGFNHYLTLQYSKAEEVFSEVLESGLEGNIEFDQEDLQKARYFLARSFEGQGNAGNALLEYNRLVSLYPDSLWALESSRRTVMLDSYYDVQAPGVDKAMELLEEVGDPVLESLIYKEIYKESETPRTDLDEIYLSTSRGAEVYITSEPMGAVVTLQGTIMGYTPLFITDLPTGEITLEAGYELEKRESTLFLEEGAVVPVSFNLSPSRASLRIITDIDINTLYLGNAALDITDEKFWDYLPEGERILTVIGETSDGEAFFDERTILLEKGVLVLTYP